MKNYLVVGEVGIEPTPSGFSDRCYRPHKLLAHIQDAKEKIVGFEPTTDCLTDNYSTK